MELYCVVYGRKRGLCGAFPETYTRAWYDLLSLFGIHLFPSYEPSIWQQLSDIHSAI